MSPIQKLAQRQCAQECPQNCGSLADLGKGCQARIVGFTHDDVVTRRLFDLGFTPGQQAELVRRAPLRDPLIYSVGGAEIVLRRAEAKRILVVS